MPSVSSFFGIVIRMYYNDHGSPHFHAEYGDAEAVYEIATWKSSGVACRAEHTLW